MERVCIIDRYKGSRLIRKEQCIKVNILRLAVGYLHVTTNRQSETENRTLELTGLGNSGKTCRLTGTSPGLPSQYPWGRVLDSSGTEPNCCCGPNPDCWLGTQTHC